jgi:hypothetical protein
LSDQQVRNAIVVGSGPSGYTAAIYLARAALEPLVFEGSVTAGGALMNTTDVENYPGFPDGVMGPQLMDDLRKQAERFGAELVTDDVTAMDLISDPKVISVGDTSTTPRPSCWRWARPTATSACPASPSCPAGACPGARPATASSSATRTSWWSAAATPPSRRRPSSPASPGR